MSEIKKQDLLELADEIEDEDLKEKTKDVIKNLEISNKSMDYEKSSLEEIPCWVGGHHYYEGGLIEHIYSVTKLCIRIADQAGEVYDEEIDRDELISAALLHDLAKQFIVKDMNSFRDYWLDHNVWISCELYSRNFPEKVLDIIMGHGGETIEPVPKSREAKILHHADALDAGLKEEGIEELVIGGKEVELEEM